MALAIPSLGFHKCSNIRAGGFDIPCSLFPVLCSLFPVPCSLFFEVVRHANCRFLDVVPLVRGELAEAKRRHLGHKAAVLSANVEARADLVGNAATIKSPD